MLKFCSLQKLSVVLKVFVIFLAGAAILGLGWLAFDPDALATAFQDEGQSVSRESPYFPIYFGLVTILVWLGLYSLWWLYRLFDLFSKAQMLSVETAHAVRKLGISLVLLGVAQVAFRPLSDLLYAAVVRPEVGEVSIEVSSDHIAFLLLAAVLTMVGQALLDGVEAFKENQRFI